MLKIQNLEENIFIDVTRSKTQVKKRYEKRSGSYQQEVASGYANFQLNTLNQYLPSTLALATPLLVDYKI